MAKDKEIKLYGHSNAREHGAYFTMHLMAMTGEELHSKADIACELAHRDIKFEELQKKYYELLYAVGTKIPKQSRHETALSWLTYLSGESKSDKARETSGST